MVGWIKRIFGKRYDVYKCDACNGTGTGYSTKLHCSKCQGTGKLDWVERVVGKSPPPPFSFTGGAWSVGQAPTKAVCVSLNLTFSKSIFQNLKTIFLADIFLDINQKVSIPLLKSIVTANIVVWIVLFLTR